MLYLQSSSLVCRYERLQVGFVFYPYITVQWPRPLAKMRKIRGNVLCLLSDSILSATYHCFSIVFCICRKAFPLPGGLRHFEGISSHFAAHKASHASSRGLRVMSLPGISSLPPRLLEGGSLNQIDSSPSTPPVWHFSTPLLLLYQLVFSHLIFFSRLVFLTFRRRDK